MIVDLEPTDDQRLIEESVSGLLADRLPVDRLREAHNMGGAAERGAWDSFVELGLFGLGLPEDKGGFGFGLPEEVLVARALGQHLVSPAVIAQMIAPHLAEEEALRQDIASGVARVAFANMTGPRSVHLLDAEGADHVLLVSGTGVKLVARKALSEGEAVATMDEAVAIQRAEGDFPAPDHDSHALRMSLLVAAYQAGNAQATCDMAVEYAKTREQFGQPIGAFQAIKHMCADMAVRAAAARTQCYHAAVTFGLGLNDGSEIAAARMIANDAALANGKANIQVHGGMGFTAECDAHLFLKRAHLLATLGYARSDEQRRVIGA